MLYERDMKGTRPTTWFAMLRRDGVLFAAVATLLLILNAVPAPHMQARATVICTLDGPAYDQTNPTAGPECPVCLISASCLGGPAAPGPQSSIAVHAYRSGERPLPPEWVGFLEQHERHRLGPIRSPPFA